MTHFRASFLKVKTSFEGLHYYENAPEEVSFLRNPHRHTFNVEIVFPVEDLDRQFEFFLFKKDLDHIINSWFKLPGFRRGKLDIFPYSCETMANIIACELVDYGLKYVEVTIQEDNENSATVVLSANSDQLKNTFTLQVIGKPGSGKTTFAKALAESLRAKQAKVHITEVSNCVKLLWPDVLETPIEEKVLFHWIHSIGLPTHVDPPNIHIIVGSREPHLIDSNDIVIRLNSSEELRRERYDYLGKQDFEAVEKRLEVLKFKDIKYDHVIDTEETDVQIAVKLCLDLLSKDQLKRKN